MQTQNTIEINKLSKKFKSHLVLDQIEAKLPSGQITGLVGPDAAGKTTLIRILAGLLSPSSGSFSFSSNINQDDIRNIGYMPQRFGLYEDLSVIDNLNLYAKLRALDKKTKEVIFAQLLEFTELKPFTKRLTGKLSGGMKQKLGLACALLTSPKILLLDEPGVGVDPQSRRELWKMVTNLSNDGMTILWSTAYIEEAEKCSHVIMLDQGKLIYEGEPSLFTSKMHGRVFYEYDSPNIRESLEYWTWKDGVCDALVQGKKLRVVLNQDLPSEFEQKSLTPTSPRLEDAYIDAVGGMNKSPSPFNSFLDDKVIVTDPNQAVIKAINLTKKFGDFTAAKNISFEVKPGMIYGLLGPNGAGKSTTFRMLCGLSKASSGQCFVANVDLLHSASEARSKLGYMAQKFSLYGELSLKQNLELFAALYNIPKQEVTPRIEMLVEALGLKKYYKQLTSTLPLGHKQRLALATATLHAPSVLFLDEPTSGVDPRTRREFWKHINAMTKAGVAVLVTTHFMEEAEYCDDISLIYKGEVIASGTPDDLKNNNPEQLADPTLEDAFIAYIEFFNQRASL